MRRFFTVVILTVSVLCHGIWIGRSCLDSTTDSHVESSLPDCCKNGICPAHRESTYCPMHKNAEKSHSPQCGMTSSGGHLTLIAALAPALVETPVILSINEISLSVTIRGPESNNDPDLFRLTPPPKPLLTRV